MPKPILSKQAFGEVDMEKIDFRKNARYVVENVIERGTANDFNSLLTYYGVEKVKELALQATYLSDVAINNCCTLFKVKPTDFKCYEKKRLNRLHWNF